MIERCNTKHVWCVLPTESQAWYEDLTQWTWNVCFPQLWPPAVSQRQGSMKRREEKDEGTLQMWACMDIVLHLIDFSSLISFACSVSQFALRCLSDYWIQQSWKDAAAGPPGTRSNGLLWSSQRRHISTNQREWHHDVCGVCTPTSIK